MKTKRIVKRGLSVALALAMTLSYGAFDNTTESQAASKAVKKVVLKIGKKKVNKKTYSLKAGKTAKLKVAVTPGKAKKSVSYKSSNKKAATVSKKGQIKAKAAGKAKITVTVKGKNGKSKKAWLNINVKSAGKSSNNSSSNVVASAVKVQLGAQTIDVGAQTNATATVLPVGASQSVKWSSSDVSVATVDDKGVVVGMKDGVAMIKATTSNGISDSAIITVKKVDVKGVKFNNESMELSVGATAALPYSITPQNATNMNVEWTSDNPEVATVINGKVSAVKAGEATITVKTVDGGYTATIKVTVKEDTKQDVDGIKAELSNHIEGYPNTVLVGNNARVNFTVTKGGMGISDQVEVAIKEKRGYANYYTINNDSISTNESGQGFVTVKLKSEYDFKSLISDLNDANAAYAGLTLELTAGGANAKTTIDVTFAQLLTQTKNSYAAIAVENQYDSLLNEIVPNNSTRAVRGSLSKEEYLQEYVTDQQVSSAKLENGDHKVVLDAAPVLIIPPISGTKEKAGYSTVVDFEKSEYSVYEDEATNVKVIENVPGGLEYLTLTGEFMHLSDYTRVVVRAYEQGTRIPIFSEGRGRVEEIFESDTNIGKDTIGNKLQIGESIFGRTANHKNIDLWIFVESKGQVCEDDNQGIKITSAEGTYKNQNLEDYELVRAPELVKWSKVSDAYTAEKNLEDAAEYLGDEYDSAKTYKYATPAFPKTGDAIIKAISKTDTQQNQYYLYPTETVDNTTKLLKANPDLLIKASEEAVSALTDPKWEVDSLGRLVVDSEKAGYVDVCATIDFGTNESYSVYSAVHYLPIPTEVFNKPSDYYAITGENVTLTALLEDINGNKANGVKVLWRNAAKEGVEVVNSEKEYGETNSQGEVKLVLKGNRKVCLDDISVVGVDAQGQPSENYTVKSLNVADQNAFTKHASIHWVKPGLFYQTRVDYKDASGKTNKGFAINTVDQDEVFEIKGENASEYLVGKTWIVGANVVGDTADKDIEIIDIDNLKVRMDSSTTDEKVVVKKTDKSNGVCTVTSDTKGNSILTMDLTGYEDASKRCKITVRTFEEDENGNEYWVDTVHTSVGTVDAGEADTITNYFGKGIKLNINWVPDGMKLSMVNNITKFDIGNKVAPVVYAKLEDKKGNGIAGQQVEYEISMNKNGETESHKVKTGKGTTNNNGLVAIDTELPTEACTYTITAKLTAETTSSTSISFTEKGNAYKVASTPKVNINANTIKVRFNAPINSKIEEFLKKFVSVKKNKDTIDVESAKIDSSDNQLLVITTNAKQTLSSDVKVSFDNKYTDDQKMVHYFLSDEGVLLTAANGLSVETE